MRQGKQRGEQSGARGGGDRLPGVHPARVQESPPPPVSVVPPPAPARLEAWAEAASAAALAERLRAAVRASGGAERRLVTPRKQLMLWLQSDRGRRLLQDASAATLVSLAHWSRRVGTQHRGVAWDCLMEATVSAMATQQQQLDERGAAPLPVPSDSCGFGQPSDLQPADVVAIIAEARAAGHAGRASVAAVEDALRTHVLQAVPPGTLDAGQRQLPPSELVQLAACLPLLRAGEAADAARTIQRQLCQPQALVQVASGSGQPALALRAVEACTRLAEVAEVPVDHSLVAAAAQGLSTAQWADIAPARAAEWMARGLVLTLRLSELLDAVQRPDPTAPTAAAAAQAELLGCCRALYSGLWERLLFLKAWHVVLLLRAQRQQASQAGSAGSAAPAMLSPPQSQQQQQGQPVHLKPIMRRVMELIAGDRLNGLPQVAGLLHAASTSSDAAKWPLSVVLMDRALRQLVRLMQPAPAEPTFWGAPHGRLRSTALMEGFDFEDDDNLDGSNVGGDAHAVEAAVGALLGYPRGPEAEALHVQGGGREGARAQAAGPHAGGDGAAAAAPAALRLGRYVHSVALLAESCVLLRPRYSGLQQWAHLEASLLKEVGAAWEARYEDEDRQPLRAAAAAARDADPDASLGLPARPRRQLAGLSFPRQLLLLPAPQRGAGGPAGRASAEAAGQPQRRREQEEHAEERRAMRGVPFSEVARLARALCAWHDAIAPDLRTPAAAPGPGAGTAAGDEAGRRALKARAKLEARLQQHMEVLGR